MDIKTIIGLVIALLLAIIAFNPGLLPLSAETVDKMKELKDMHFLINGSGKVTFAHIFMLIGAVAFLWFLFTIIKTILEKTAKDSHSKTIAILLTGLLRWLLRCLQPLRLVRRFSETPRRPAGFSYGKRERL